jgi:curved DNA-binding protein CbpA
LLTKEALDILGLGPGATSVEIKEAYRDLVKVWHPDRFGSDPRLRQKAEDKLKQINNAYLVLQSDQGMGRGAASSRAEDAQPPPYSWSEPIPQSDRRRSNRNATALGWLYGCLAISLIVLAGYGFLENRAMRTASPPPASVPPVVDSSRQAAPRISDRDVPPKDSGGTNRSASAPFQVRFLSDTETAQVESACSSQKELQDQTAYHACLKAQLDLITDARGQPDLSALDGAERESIGSVCAEAKRLHGANGYNRCVVVQMAELAAESARPDMSKLSETDRDSIEAACKNAKYREGPTAYNRCRVRLIKLLADAK